MSFSPTWPDSGRLPAGLDDDIVDNDPHGAPCVPAPASAHAPLDLSNVRADQAKLACPQPPASRMRSALRAPYAPVACGPWEARRAIAAWMSASGRPVVADDLVLTASTSEALSYLLKWFCRPGDIVAHMQPGYPLLAHLAAAEGLVAKPVASRLTGGRWHLDVQSLGHLLAHGCRCVVLTSPNNPTGACLSAAETEAVAALCNAAHALCIVDEVFAPYRLSGGAWGPSAMPGTQALVSLGGMSKAALLPQLKVSWLAIEGAPAFRRQARIAMTWLSDLYLSVSAPSAAVASSLAPHLPALHERLTARLRRNAHWLAKQLSRHAIGTLHIPDGGFVAPLQFAPQVCAAFDIGAHGHGAKRLQDAAGVCWQTGDLYDLPPHIHAVVSLLPAPRRFAAAWRRVIKAAAR